MNSKAMIGVALAVAVMIPLAGCAGKVRLSAANMCKASGGTYNTSDQTCDAPAVNKKKASAMCEAHGGTYITALQTCEVEGDK